MGIFKTITEGGQIWAHRVRLAKQVFKTASFISLVFFIICFGIQLSQIPSIYYKATGYYIKASLLKLSKDSIKVDGNTWGSLTHQSTSKAEVRVHPDIVQKICKKHATITGHTAVNSLFSSMKRGSRVFTATLVAFLFKGWISRKKKHIAGKEIISPLKLALKLKLSNKASSLKLGRIPLVKGTETQHILITGATGTGKTNAYHHFLPQIRKLKQRAVIVDTTGEYVERYYRPGKDVLMNPLDPRSVAWHPWCECENISDYKAMAQNFIPSSYREEENFWRKGAQEVLFASLSEFAEIKRTSALSKLLLHDSLSTVATLLQGTTATAYLDMASEKTAGSVRAVASSFLECLDLIPDTDNPFSIRKWVSNEQDDSWLFLNCTTRQRASLIPLLSVWLSVGISSLLQLTPKIDRRVWFVIDELPRLNRLKDLENFLTESRKYGGCGLLALQSPAQLETIYGRTTTSTILGNCATRIAFAEYDAMTAERIAKSFGEKEVRESQEALSYGAHEMRDGVNLSFQTKTVPVISPTAIQTLRTHEAYVKLIGDLPISKLRLYLK